MFVNACKINPSIPLTKHPCSILLTNNLFETNHLGFQSGLTAKWLFIATVSKFWTSCNRNFSIRASQQQKVFLNARCDQIENSRNFHSWHPLNKKRILSAAIKGFTQARIFSNNGEEQVQFLMSNLSCGYI